MYSATRDDNEAAFEELMRAAVTELPSDFKFEIIEMGHTFNFYTEYHDYQPFEFVSGLRNEQIFSAFDARGLAQAWRIGKPITELTFEVEQDGRKSVHKHNRISFSVSRYGGHERCAYCGQRDFHTDGFKIWPDRMCPYPNGIPVRVEIEIPSGKLMVGNDFRDAFPVADDDFYVNEASEIARCIEVYADEGKMLHFFVGNSCPSVYRNLDDPNHLITANALWNEDEESEEPIPGYDPRDVASVCTDLWWVSIADADEARKRGLTEEGAPGWTENYVVDVEPGTYVMDYHGLRKDFDRDDYTKPIVYADIYRKGTDATASA